MILTSLAIIFIMIVINGLFAAYELALASVRLERLKFLVDRNKTGAKTAVRMKVRIEWSLAVVQIGITLVGACAAATGGASAVENVEPQLMAWLGVSETVSKILALMLVVLPLSALTIVVGELIPKVFALRNPELVCLALSPAMHWFSLAAFPAVWSFEGLTHLFMRLLEKARPQPAHTPTDSLLELRMQVNLLRTAQIIGVQEERIILQASRLSTLKVKDILVPVEDMVLVEADAPLSRNMVIAHLHLHTRFPVTERLEDPQGIIGYITFKEMLLLAKTHPGNPVIREITRPIISFHYETRVSEALQRMLAQQLHLALARDDQDQVVGMITQEDIFEELVGQIEDEFDRLPRHVVPSGRQWVVGGGATLGQLRTALKRPELGEGISVMATVDSWLQRARMPDRLHGGDAFALDGVGILVRKTRRHHVTEILLEPDLSRFKQILPTPVPKDNPTST